MVISIKDKKWTRENIMELTRDEVIELWKQCPAAEMTELVGEFDPVIPDGGDKEVQRRIAVAMFDENSQRGCWLGKAFWPLSKTRGDGYNRWGRPGGKVERYQRFATGMGTSLIDGRPSFLMYYSAYQDRYTGRRGEGLSFDEIRKRGIGLVDEIRKLVDGIYLLLGTVNLPDGKRSPPGHSVLVGPVSPYVRADNPTEELR